LKCNVDASFNKAAGVTGGDGVYVTTAGALFLRELI
jgi:hypothetical protein